MNTQNLSALKIHKLSQEQYDRELEAGRIDASAMYLTPEEKLTAADVGAAPTGFGLGTNAINVASADTITANGFYETAITINGYTQSCIIWHNQLSEAYAGQFASVVYGLNEGSALHRVKTKGVWQPWRFLMTKEE